MSENTPIQEISERLVDFVAALRQAGADEAARRALKYERHFSDVARVRKAVQGLQEQLHHWRDHPEELPESATVQVACNVLEDECRKALKGGVIVAAPPTLRQKAQRKLLVMAMTVGGAALLSLGVFALQIAGFDWTDPFKEPEIRHIELSQGSERSIGLDALTNVMDPEHVIGVEFALAHGCEGEEFDGVSCAPLGEARSWPDGPLPTFEAKLTHQAYGLLFAFGPTELTAERGSGTLWLAATSDTPQGDYLLELKAAYLGYEPPTCSFGEKLLGMCGKPAVGPGRHHGGIEVLPVRVVVGPPSEADRIAARERAARLQREARERAEARAQRLVEMIAAIEVQLDVNDRVIRKKQFREAQERLEKLGVLFAPVDTLLADPEATGSVPQEVIDARERFGDQQDALHAFEESVFDQLFAALHGDPDGPAPDGAAVMAKIAARDKIPLEYVEEIYADRADQLKQRIEDQARARLEAKKQAEAALRARCGELEGGGWKSIEAFLKAHLEDEHVAIKLGECMSPLLTERCWEVGCDYTKRVTLDELRPSKSRDFSAMFHIKNNEVLGYVPRR